MTTRTRTKTEHSGAKNGGGYYGRREQAKRESNIKRRHDDKAEVVERVEALGGELEVVSVAAVTEEKNGSEQTTSKLTSNIPNATVEAGIHALVAELEAAANNSDPRALTPWRMFLWLLVENIGGRHLNEQGPTTDEELLVLVRNYFEQQSSALHAELTRPSVQGQALTFRLRALAAAEEAPLLASAKEKAKAMENASGSLGRLLGDRDVLKTRKRQQQIDALVETLVARLASAGTQETAAHAIAHEVSRFFRWGSLYDSREAKAIDSLLEKMGARPGNKWRELDPRDAIDEVAKAYGLDPRTWHNYATQRKARQP